MAWDWKSVRERRMQAEEPQPTETDASGGQPEVEPETSDWNWTAVGKARARGGGLAPNESDDLIWRPLDVRRIGNGKSSRVGWGGNGTHELTYHDVYGCSFCGATGEKPPGTRCPVCRGDGQVRVKPPVMRCAFCNGRGEVPLRSGVTCTVCRGKGRVTVKEPVETCGSCRGRGRKPGEALYCIACKGVGVVTGKGATAPRSARASVRKLREERQS